MKKTHDGTDAEPLVATFEEAAALWRKGIKAHVVVDVAIPTGEPPAPKARQAVLPDLDCEIPF